MQLENILAAPAAPPAKPTAAPPRERGEPFEAEYARDPSEPPSAETAEAPEAPASPEPPEEEILVEVEKLLLEVPIETAPKGEAKVAVELEVVAPSKGAVAPPLVTEETVLPASQASPAESGQRPGTRVPRVSRLTPRTAGQAR